MQQQGNASCPWPRATPTCQWCCEGWLHTTTARLPKAVLPLARSRSHALAAQHSVQLKTAAAVNASDRVDQPVVLHTPAHHAPRRVGCCVETARACMPAAPVFTAQRVQRRAGCCKGNRRNHAHSCAGRTCQPAPQLAIAIAVVSHGGRLRGSGLLGHAHTRRQVQTPREASAAPTPHRRIVAQHQVS